jgi:UDP-GlcNAc:undecaprenyl-phosphate GlcNAc-1-phosphate transferase
VGSSPQLWHFPLVLALTFWLAGAANALNMLDGLDGLAAGVSAIAALGLGAVALGAGNVAAAVLAFAVAGACLGFLPYNFRPAKTFMGDMGSLFLGFMLASSLLLLIRGAGEDTSPSVFVAAVLAMALPVGDMLLAMIRRYMNHKPIFRGDRSHFYDQLRDRFHLSVVHAVLICYLVGVLMAVLAWAVAQLPVVHAALVVVGCLLVSAIGLVRAGFVRIDQAAAQAA